MFLKIISFISLTISAVLTEQPINKSGPYAATGWRPSKPFDFPRESFQPRAEVATQRQVRPSQGQRDFQVTKARVEHVGQVQDNVFIPNNRQPHKEYLPPNRQNPDSLSVQDLPLETIIQQYDSSRQQQQQQQDFEQSINRQQFFPKPRGPQFNKETPQSRVPATKYGPPQTLDFNIIYPDPEPRDSFDKETASGSDVADYTSDPIDKRKEYVRAKQGQYFVLGPDNTLQRVVFTTTQNEEEKRTNGFTAELKYTPIGELRDPVFRYNNRGQLVRALKK